MPRLEPCPFCGRVVHVRIKQVKHWHSTFTENTYVIECAICDVRMRKSDRARLEETWNRRAELLPLPEGGRG